MPTQLKPVNTMKTVVSLKSYGVQHLIGVRYVTLFFDFKFELLSQIYISSRISVWISALNDWKKNVQTKYFSQMFCFKRYLCFVATCLNSIFRELKSSIMYQKNAQLKIIAIHKFAETCPSAIICGMKIGNVPNAVKEIDAITRLL